MAAELDGMRIATLEARMTGALASLISKRGGEPLCAPALREAPLDCAEDVRYLLDKLESEELDVVVFQTGVGARALFADRQGRLPFLLSALRGVTTVCRGPKPTAALFKEADRQWIMRGVTTVCRGPKPTAALKQVDVQIPQVLLRHIRRRSCWRL